MRRNGGHDNTTLNDIIGSVVPDAQGLTSLPMIFKFVCRNCESMLRKWAKPLFASSMRCEDENSRISARANAICARIAGAAIDLSI